MYAPLIAQPLSKGTAGSTKHLARPSAAVAPPRLGHDPADEMAGPQRSFGNQATLRALGLWHTTPIAVQPKLAIGSTADPLEREADSVAERVMRMPDGDCPPSDAPVQVSRKCENCDEEEHRLQRSPGTGGGLNTAPGIVHDVLSSPGRPLDAGTRAFFEPRFGRDFSGVRVHDDAQARSSASAVGAKAYTVGRQIVFGAEQSPADLPLLAHELAHVVQQAPAVERRSPRTATATTSDHDVSRVEAHPYRTPATASRPGAAAGLALRRQPTFTGDGKHLPTDVAYATTVGQADAARLRKAGTLSAADRADINAKFQFFQPPAWEAYGKEVKPALSEVTTAKPAGQEPEVEPFTDTQLERMGQVAQVNVLFTQIQALKNDRVKTWTDTATAKEPKPLQYVLDLVVAMVALGMGGVLGMVVSKGIKGEYLKDFVYLAGLELTDKLAVDSYEHAMTAAGDALRKGTLNAVNQRNKSVEAALSSNKDDLIGTYSEAMRLQNIQDTLEQQTEFNMGAKSTYRRGALEAKTLALKIIYDQLFTQPQVFHRELSEGFIRLMDEAHVAKVAEKYGGDKARAWRESSGLHEPGERKGNLLVLAGTPSFSLKDWGNPDFSFTSYYALATGANTKTLMKLANTPVKDLPLSLGFRYWAENPFYRLFYGGDPVKVWFTRNPDGDIYLDDLGEGAMEWLASYYSGLGRELSDDERGKWAPLGAKKLYEANKGKPITTLSNSDIL